MNSKDFIDQIFRTNFTFNNVEQAICQSNLLDTVSKDIYPDPKRFIIEILQNADDASFNFRNNDLNIKFNQFHNTLIISHQGKPFSTDDIKSICSAGNSTKIKSDKATGYKGIGFKSVFDHSHKVVIISNNYHFRFDKSHFTNEFNWQPEWGSYQEYKLERERKNLSSEIKKPWQIIPIYTDKHEIEEKYWNISKDFNVNFIVYFNSDNSSNACRTYLYEIESDYQYLLFLKSKELNFILCDEGEIVKTYSKELSQSFNNGSFIKILGNNKPIENYFFMNFDINIYHYKHKYEKELENEDIPEKMRNLSNIVISLAIPYENNKTVKSIEPKNRLLYAFLPTKENYNFPFLINTNFLLDAGRTQLREGSWNKMIFSMLPQCIYSFQKNLFEYFGNSYTNSFLFELNISYKGFEEEFSSNLIKNDVQDVFIITKTGERKRYIECYINSFLLNINEKKYNSILKLFDFIYGMEKSEKILKLYFIYNKKIKFDKDYEINPEDNNYIEQINRLYEYNSTFITEEDILNFINSETFKENFSSLSFYRLLNILKDKTYQNKLSQLKIIPDIKGNFYKPSDFIIYQPTDDILKNNIISELTEQIYISTNKDKKEIRRDVLDTFSENDALNLLGDIGVQRINYQLTLGYLLDNIQEFYKKENKGNTIAIIKLVFKEWVNKSDIHDKKAIIEKIKNIKYLLNKNHDFMRLQDLVVGPFYNQDQRFKNYNSFYVSEEYYEYDTKKEDWVQFFKELELWLGENYEKCFLMTLDKEHFDEIPFILPEYKESIKKYKTSLYYICPRLNHVFEEDPNSIKDFFDKNINFSEDKDQRNFPNFRNYFKWFIKDYKKVMITKKLEIQSIDNIYSYEIFKDKPEIIKKFLEQNLDICASEFIDLHMNKITKLKVKYDPSCLRTLIESLEKFIKITENQKEKLELKKFFQDLLLNLAINDMKNLSGQFIDVNDEINKAENLYYFKDYHIKDLLEQTLKNKKLIEIKIPDTEDVKIKEKFLNFAKKNGVRIYSIEDVEYHTYETNENKEISSKLEQITSYIKELCIREGVKNAAEQKLKLIKFFNSPIIKIKTSYDDCVDFGISFYEKKPKSFKIYFLKDDVYTSWKHPTIIYYISRHIAKFINCNISSQIMTLFMLENKEDIERFMINYLE